MKFSKLFGLEPIVGDIRAALIGALSGAAVALVGTYMTTGPTLEYKIFVNEHGYASPRGLFDLAEEQDSAIKLKFIPTEFRDAFVCEFKLIKGDSWRDMALAYLDTYRDCFDVSARGEKEFVVSPNLRSLLLKRNGTAYTCKCKD